MNVRLLNSEDAFSFIDTNEFQSIFKGFTDIYNSIIKNQNYKFSDNSASYLYLKKGDIFLIEEKSGSSRFKIDETIIREKEENSYSFYANKSGYFGIDNGVLKILDPLVTDSDKFNLYFILIPVGVNFYFLEKLLQTYINNETDYLTPCKLLVKEGLKPVPSVDASIEWKVAFMDHPPLLNNGKIDYKSYSKYLEVEKGSVLAEKFKMKPGIPGVDVYGNTIAVSKAKDIPFNIGENIIEDKSDDDKILYIASETGVLEVTDSLISVSKTLIINSDISFSTGNIKFSADVHINGNIKSMFTVECGGDLLVDGSIENGATVICEGNVTVTKGIIGNDTKLKIIKNLSAEYIQDCNIRIEGDLTVLNSIYHSSVFSGGFLIVKGERVRGSSHGSIVGGQISSMKGIKVHSVGSIASKAHLICGFDVELRKKLLHLKEAIPVIRSKIIKLQSNLGIDISKSADQLGRLSHFEKERLKSKLKELKGYILQKDELEDMMEEMSDKVYSKDVESLKITIEKFILEDTKITIGTYKKDIKDKGLFSVYSVINGEIVMLSTS